MRFTCEKTDLSALLSFVKGAVDNRPSQPILGTIMLVADTQAQTLTATGFNGDRGIVSTIPVAVEMGGSVAMPVLFQSTIDTLPKELIQVEVDEVNQATITFSKGKTVMSGLAVDDYPALPSPGEGASTYELPADMFSDAIRRVASTASGDETKQVLMGVHFSSLDDGPLEIAATDGHRLSRLIASEQNPLGSEATIPADSLRAVAKAIASQKADNLELCLGSSLTAPVAQFTIGNSKIFTRLLDGQYPNYRQLIPAAFKFSAKFNRAEMLATLERIQPIADLKNKVVAITFADKECVVSVDAHDVKTSESVPIETTSANLITSFNCAYLIAGLKACSGESAIIQGNSPTSPFILSETDYTYLLMPVQVRK